MGPQLQHANTSGHPDISHLSPRIWQRIYLYESNGTTLSHDQALWWMYKSDPLPFDVRIDISTGESLRSSPLLPQVLSQTSMMQYPSDGSPELSCTLLSTHCACRMKPVPVQSRTLADGPASYDDSDDVAIIAAQHVECSCEDDRYGSRA